MNILENVSSFFSELLLKFITQLPESPFDYSSFLASLNNILGVLNYFIPFYLFRTILIVWVPCLFLAWQVLMMVRWIKQAIISSL